MNHIVGILLLASMGCYTISAQQYTLRTVIRIQNVLDLTYITIPALNFATKPTTAAPPTTTAPPTMATDPTAVTTVAPVPAIPVGGGGGSPNIRHWRLNWALATNGTSVIRAVDLTSSAYRFLGWDATLGLVVKAYDTFEGETINNYAWTFVKVFDSVTWTFKHQLRLNGGSGDFGTNCLCRMGGAWNTTTCSKSNKAVLFNVFNG